MNFLFFEDRLSWLPVLSLIYLTLLLMATDFVWRTTNFGGRATFLGAIVLGFAGCALIFFLGSGHA